MLGSYKQGGFIRDKYIIQKANGNPIDPEARYFVLRYDADPHARRALMAYAISIRRENRELSDDLFDELTDFGMTETEARNAR
jgi:hypothetical protein